MQRNGQLPPKQNCVLIIMMLLAAMQSLSGNVLRLQGFLRTGEILLPMSPESKRLLLQKYAEQHANLSPRQVRSLTSRQLQRLKCCGIHAFLFAKLFGKQWSQPCQMKVKSDLLRYLMTKSIPRIMISPISMSETPITLAWQLTGSVVFDPSGYICSGGNWNQCHHRVIAITSHSNQPLVALMHSDGNVWIGKIGDPDGLFQLIYSPKTDDEIATAIAFHPSGNLIAVAIRAQVILYEISPAVKPKVLSRVSFYESGYFCPKPKFSANTLAWNPAGNFLTVISAGNLSMCFHLKPDTNEVICGFNGGMKYAELWSHQKGYIPPSCSCFSVDGGTVMTGYPDGTLMTRVAEQTDKGLSLRCLKLLNKFLSGKVNNIVPHPTNHSVFAIEVAQPFSMRMNVLIALVNNDGSVTITATIPDAKSPQFHKDLLLVLSGRSIQFHRINRCNSSCLVTEFQLQGNGPFSGEIDTFCVKTAPNGKVMLYYSISGKLRKAEIALS